MFEQIIKCDCGFGVGFYHYGPDLMHEYNPLVSEKKATEKYQNDRSPVGSFFGHIDGRRAVLVVGGTEISFRYCEYGGSKEKAYEAAARSLISDHRQTSMF